MVTTINSTVHATINHFFAFIYNMSVLFPHGYGAIGSLTYPACVTLSENSKKSHHRCNVRETTLLPTNFLNFTPTWASTPC
jgi:hypothetical protein